MPDFHLKIFKRYKMEIALDKWVCPPVKLPLGFEMTPWASNLTEPHGIAIYESFKDSIDSELFITFTSQTRCIGFMKDLISRTNFLPSTTWLLRERTGSPAARLLHFSRGYTIAGTIQGVIKPGFIGGIQNVGILPDYRGRGLSKQLLYYALWGFQQAGLKVVELEVTAENDVAINLYKKIGFHITQVLEKPSTVV